MIQFKILTSVLMDNFYPCFVYQPEACPGFFSSGADLILGEAKLFHREQNIKPLEHNRRRGGGAESLIITKERLF